jgi:hypothetical protein
MDPAERAARRAEREREKQRQREAADWRCHEAASSGSLSKSVIADHTHLGGGEGRGSIADYASENSRCR